jgi:hypothetical protein
MSDPCIERSYGEAAVGFGEKPVITVVGYHRGKVVGLEAPSS